MCGIVRLARMIMVKAVCRKQGMVQLTTSLKTCKVTKRSQDSGFKIWTQSRYVELHELGLRVTPKGPQIGHNWPPKPPPQ